ncbi:MAG: ATP-dependent DNA helicase [Eubacterium sp.]|nr:ATP-dependent DNA helicase [Eubacterium sp.]
MTSEKKTVRISVRNLVEFLLRSGDITGGTGRLADREAMLAGSRIHRKLQGRRGAAYRAEVSLKEVVDFGSFDLVVEGRADGIDTEASVIEEIKGIYQDVSELESPVPVHLAQAKCYACIYARKEKLETVRIRMTYCNLETEEVRSFTSAHTAAELSEWFDALCRDYRRWAAFLAEWTGRRNESILQLAFPFPYRAGQRDMVAASYRTILQGRQLFVQAPTGVGKTISAVFPAVRALGEGRGEKLFYLTAKTIARTVAEEAFSILREKGLCCKTLTLTAKEKICPEEKPVCDPAFCPRAKGHYDRINDALYDLLTSDREYTRNEIQAWGSTRSVCPYELQLDLADFADAVICDYNYAFDPAARLSRYFGEASRRQTCLLLIDEAHNLVDRAREMFSAALEKEAFLRLRRLIRDRKQSRGFKALDRSLARCNQILLTYRKESAEDPDAIDSYGSRCSRRKEIQALIPPLMTLAGVLEGILKERPGEGAGVESESLREELLNFYFEVSTFLGAWQTLDDHFMIYTETRQGSFLLKLFCVDPSRCLQEVLDRSAGTVFFSATMLPMQYYESLLTTEKDNYRIMIPSPFDPSRRHLAVGTDVSTRYTQRGELLYQKLAAYIYTVTKEKQGNYMVYFPSYRMMEDVLEAYRQQFEQEMPETSRTQPAGEEQELFVQQPGMSEADRDDFLKTFRRPGKQTRIGFCVMGGIFAEGIDLAGDQLIGALVVGTGLPQVSGERELLKRFYDEKGMSGFDYAYRFPGLNKVLQAAGRVIRTAEDVGVMVLLDERFKSPAYYRYFPREWSDIHHTSLDRISGEIRAFWDRETLIY